MAPLLLSSNPARTGDFLSGRAMTGGSSGGENRRAMDEAGLLRFRRGQNGDLDSYVQAADRALVEMVGERPMCGSLLPATLRRYARVQGALYVGLSSATAYRLQPARAVCRSLAERLSLTAAQVFDMEIALHEAVVNGVVHGNLGLFAGQHQSMESFSAFFQTVETHLDHPSSLECPLEIAALWTAERVLLMVRDQGEGYDYQKTLAENAALMRCQAFGGGLVLIRNLSQGIRVSRGGRLVSMRFSR